MSRVVSFALLAYLFAHVACQGMQEFAKGAERRSMLGMLAKIIELNGTIDQVLLAEQGSTTEQMFGRVWFNATERPLGICEHEEEFTEEIEVIERIPMQVEVEVWCWSEVRCTEWETHYREEKQKKNVTQTRSV
jgi:hypothetical protein